LEHLFQVIASLRILGGGVDNRRHLQTPKSQRPCKKTDKPTSSNPIQSNPIPSETHPESLGSLRSKIYGRQELPPRGHQIEIQAQCQQQSRTRSDRLRRRRQLRVRVPVPVPVRVGVGIKSWLCGAEKST